MSFISRFLERTPRLEDSLQKIQNSYLIVFHDMIDASFFSWSSSDFFFENIR